MSRIARQGLWKLNPNIARGILSLAVLGAFVVPGLRKKPISRFYSFSSPKLPKDFSAKVALITDFHSGEGSPSFSEILSATSAQKPDLILLGGDMVSSLPFSSVDCSLLSGLSSIAPTYFVSGNHEAGRQGVGLLYEHMQSCGVFCLEQQWVSISIKNQPLVLAGLCDPRLSNLL